MLKLASPFQDHAVLQRDADLTVWGWGTPGHKVSVSLGNSVREADIGADGSWRLKLAAQPAGGPFELSVVSGAETLVRKDILIGDLWLASGQSNMAMVLRDCRDAKAEIASANYPAIRMFTTESVIAMEPSSTVGGEWRICAPEAAGNFSGAAYFFARRLHQNLGVPIGVINSSWGGTIAEAWTSREGLLSEPALRFNIKDLDAMLSPDDSDTKRAFHEARREWRDTLPKDRGNSGFEKGWHSPDFDDSQWDTIHLPQSWQQAGHKLSGVFWFRRQMLIPPQWKNRPLELAVGACDKRDYTYFNGHFLGSLGMEDSPTAWKTPRRYTVATDQLAAGAQTIAVRVFSEMYQGGMIGPEADMWIAPVDADPSERIPLAGEWRYTNEQDYGLVSTVAPPAIYGPDNPNSPTGLFNGMIAPFIPLSLKGFIWYQGESNAMGYSSYQSVFSTMIRDWRRLFRQGDLPFYFVQLAGYMHTSARPTESNWAELREAQRRTLCLPSTGMAVAIDIGEADDIHPKNKQDIGERLALAALQQTYRCPAATGSSPQPRRAWRDGARAKVEMDNTAGGLRLSDGDAPLGFAIAGKDRRFHWAEARITAPDTIELNSPEVPEPVWVRYAWDDNPLTNLYSGGALPAAPFEISLPY